MDVIEIPPAWPSPSSLLASRRSLSLPAARQPTHHRMEILSGIHLPRMSPTWTGRPSCSYGSVNWEISTRSIETPSASRRWHRHRPRLPQHTSPCHWTLRHRSHAPDPGSRAHAAELLRQNDFPTLLAAMPPEDRGGLSDRPALTRTSAPPRSTYWSSSTVCAGSTAAHPSDSLSSCSGGTDAAALTVGSRQQLENYPKFRLMNWRERPHSTRHPDQAIYHQNPQRDSHASLPCHLPIPTILLVSTSGKTSGNVIIKTHRFRRLVAQHPA